MRQNYPVILAVILAAGQGKRMGSRQPKVLQPIGGKAMIFHLLETLNALAPDRQAIIYGHRGETVRERVKARYPSVEWVLQKEQLGTGHAVLQAMAMIRTADLTLILSADTPLVEQDTLRELIAAASRSGFAVLTAELDAPRGYGRILRDAEGNVRAIVEEKDATTQQRAICEINSGMMAVRSDWLSRYLPLLGNDNAQREYYLTELVALVGGDGHKVTAVTATNAGETTGINDRVQLAQAETFYRAKQAQRLMQGGATLIDPARIDIHGEVQIGRDVHIEPNVFFKGTVRLGDDVKIESGCVLCDSTIGNGTVIRANSVIEAAEIGERAVIGPFARIRPKTRLLDHCRIGNFVEIKAATIGSGSKINHLSYIGDAQIGANVNVGAGTITCNYDGANKFKTVLADEVFIGSNTALVAPLSIGYGATIGAGSVITRDVPKQTLAFTRAALKTKAGWPRPKKGK